MKRHEAIIELSPRPGEHILREEDILAAIEVRLLWCSLAVFNTLLVNYFQSNPSPVLHKQKYV
jgi:hypothetical protein